MTTDRDQRLRAIDVNSSAIVQAPAGSGKTELLIQRLLALLAVVDKPQQILAITFTNKAATEMRQRLVEALGAAAATPQPDSEHAAQTWQLARRALLRHGDSLLRHPGQLAIQTIDSLCATLVRKMPWTTAFGGIAEIAEDAQQLYREAVSRLFARLAGNAAVNQPLTIVLQHLDNDMAVVEKMLVALLGRRDQWLRHLPAVDENLLADLNAVLEQVCSEQLAQLRRQLPAPLVMELIACATVAAANSDAAAPVAACRDLAALPGETMADLPAWLGLAELLLTSGGALRKTVTTNNGFPAGPAGAQAKERMLQLLAALSAYPEFAAALQRARSLPRASYQPQQWQLLQALFALLPQLVAELWLVFRAAGKTDFIEIALKANQSLGATDNPSELLLKIDQQLRHILVDEFQDTSRMQYQLFSTLTAGWEEGDGRTLFLVGDPMQSIYRFREAEVGLFLHSFTGRFGEQELPLKPLRLRSNFRSQQGIVDWVNRTFAAIFPAQTDLTSGAVPLAAADPVKPPLAGDAVQIYPYADVNDAAEAQQVVEIIRQARREDPDQTIAILVRGRNHLLRILPLLRREQIAYQAQDIDRLEARPAALDILNLARALVHRGDRLAWTAVLRAPWCGLTLTDLHALLAGRPAQTVPALVNDAAVRQGLSDDGRLRLERVWPILQQALSARGQRPLRDLVEGCWMALGGAVGLTAAALDDAELVFGLLEQLDVGGDLEGLDLLEKRMQQLFAAPDSRSSSALQIMTIHKAKGLQFDTVILPGLGKKPRSGDNPLLRWVEHPRFGLLLAPVAERGSQQKDPVYQLVSHLDARKEDHESARLLYVATTRAVRRLHLLGAATPNSHGELRPARGSLLEKLWPAVEASFATLDSAVTAATVTTPPAAPQLERLPPAWCLPETRALALPPTAATLRASQVSGEESTALLHSGWESSVQRHIGSLVHQLFERIVRFGVSFWQEQTVHAREITLRRSLQRLGVAASELDAAVARVVEAVQQTLASARGRWLLDAHAEGAAELPISGTLDGDIIHAVIDRTFVAKGVRWVVDYKLSSPAPGERIEDFLVREGEHYRPQMITYMRLMEAYDARHPVQGAFYFPLVDGWFETP